jgi:hypothetical protein
MKIIDGLTCCHTSDLIQTTEMPDISHVLENVYPLSSECLKKEDEKSCINSSYFHCSQSFKCIPYHRVNNGTKDCFYRDDELFNACQLNDSNRYRCIDQLNKCLMPVAVGNALYNCLHGEDETFLYDWNSMHLMPFGQICNFWYD